VRAQCCIGCIGLRPALNAVRLAHTLFQCTGKKDLKSGLPQALRLMVSSYSRKSNLLLWREQVWSSDNEHSSCLFSTYLKWFRADVQTLAESNFFQSLTEMWNHAEKAASAKNMKHLRYARFSKVVFLLWNWNITAKITYDLLSWIYA